MEPLGTPSGLLEPSRTRLGASGTGFSLWNARSAWNARKAILRPLYCSLAGDIISVLHPPLRILWNARRAIGSALGQWNARRALGTGFSLLEQPQATGTPQASLLFSAWNARKALRPWNARRAILYCSLAGDIISVLHPPLRTLWNARRAIGSALGQWNALRPLEQSLRLYLERAKRIWNSRRLLERALALLERRIAATRARVCDGNAMNVR